MQQQQSLARKVKIREAAVNDIKKFFDTTVHFIYNNYIENEHAKLLAAERTVRLKYETVTELSKDILDLTDEDNFEIEYEKNSDFDMYYHERHIELAKFIKDKDGTCTTSSNSDYSSVLKWFDRSDKYSTSDSKCSFEEQNKCPGENKHYNGFPTEQYSGIPGERNGVDLDDTVNELTSNELSNKLLELFEQDSLETDNNEKKNEDNVFYDEERLHVTNSYNNDVQLSSYNQHSSQKHFGPNTGFAVYYINHSDTTNHGNVKEIDTYHNIGVETDADGKKKLNDTLDDADTHDKQQEETVKDDGIRNPEVNNESDDTEEDEQVNAESDASDNTLNEVDKMSSPFDEKFRCQYDDVGNGYKTNLSFDISHYEVKMLSKTYNEIDKMDPQFDERNCVEYNGLDNEYDTNSKYNGTYYELNKATTKQDNETESGYKAESELNGYRYEVNGSKTTCDAIAKTNPHERSHLEENELHNEFITNSKLNNSYYEINKLTKEDKDEYTPKSQFDNSPLYEITKLPSKQYNEEEFDKYDYDSYHSSNKDDINAHMTTNSVTQVHKGEESISATTTSDYSSFLKSLDTNDKYSSCGSKYSYDNFNEYESASKYLNVFTSPHNTHLEHQAANQLTMKEGLNCQLNGYQTEMTSESKKYETRYENEVSNRICPVMKTDESSNGSKYTSYYQSKPIELSSYTSERDFNQDDNKASLFSNSDVVILPNKNIRTFDGDRKQWKSFIESFECEIDSNEDLSNIEKMEYLLSNLSGEPKCFINRFNLCKENYGMALHILKDRYGKKTPNSNL